MVVGEQGWTGILELSLGRPASRRTMLTPSPSYCHSYQVRTFFWGGGGDSEKVGIRRVEEVREEEERGKEWIGGERRYVKWSLREEGKRGGGEEEARDS